MGMPDQGARIRRCWERGVGGGIGQRVGVGGNWLREDECEVLVEAGDEVVLRAEVRGELEASEGQCPEKSGAGGAHKALDPGLAEEIDGLAWIADKEDGLRVAVPGFGEHLNEVVLSGGGVLHFVDKEMLKARAQGRGEVVRAGIFIEGVAGEEAEFGEVALVVCSEDELELDQGTAENTEERLCDSPLARGIAGRRESVDSEKHLQQIVAMA